MRDLEKPADVGGTAYGLEGYIPATTLQREGAAFGSAAQMLPGDQLSAGRQQASATLANDPNLASLQGDLGKIAATQPAVYQKLLSTLQEMGYKKAELGLSAQKFSLDQQKTQFDEQAKVQSLHQSQQRINMAAAKAAQSNKQAWARIGISDQHLKMEIAKQAITAKSGGISATDKSRYTALAQARAEKMTQGSINPTTGKAEPQLGFQDAMNQALSRGCSVVDRFPDLRQGCEGRLLTRSNHGLP